MDIMIPTEDGHFVSEKHAQISEIIQDFDPNLQLAWIPPEHRTVFDLKPFAIIHTHPTSAKQTVVMYVSEDELDERVLARLFEGDITKNDVLARLEAEDKARSVMKLKQEMDKAEARQDFIKSVVGSGIHSYRHNGRIIPT